MLPIEHPPSSPEMTQGITLAELLSEVQLTIRATFPKDRREWVRAQVVLVKTVKSHLSLELTEHTSEGSLAAKATAWIWASLVPKLQHKFSTVTGGELRAGIAVLVQVSVEFQPKNGLSLIVHDVDPSFTVGDMEVKLAHIRERLQSEGSFEKNKRLPAPTEFCRVAVLSPVAAAGLGDFQSVATALVRHNLCEFDYFPAQFQGMGVPDSVVGALRQVYTKHREKPYDALVVIRGGGAKSDLHYLNEYEIANAITKMPVPVFVGIGHEQDTTLLDEIANRRFGTPSLVVGHIRETIVSNARQAEKHWQAIATTAKRRATQAQAGVDRELERTRSGSRQKLIQAQNAAESRYREVLRGSQTQIETARANIRQWATEIVSAGPKQALKRGYAVVRDDRGKPVTKRAQAAQLKRIEIEFADGRMKASPITENLSIGEKE